MFRIRSKEKTFSDHFEELAEKIHEGGTLFIELLDRYDHADAILFRMKEIENEADSITHRIYQKLHRTFITPLDREDIYALANKMDDILDMIEASAARMRLYRIEEPVQQIRELAVILNDSIALVKKVIYAMRRNKKNVRAILEDCVAINSLENKGDKILRQSMVQLFEKDAIELIKWKEIFERIEAATDVCEDVSNIIEGILLKNG